MVLVIELHSTQRAHRAWRDGLFNLVRSTPPTLKYEPGLIVAENDYVIVHGRFSGTGRPRNWIAADIRAVVAADPSIAARLAATGQVVDVRGPAEFAASIKEQHDKLADIAQAIQTQANISIDRN